MVKQMSHSFRMGFHIFYAHLEAMRKTNMREESHRMQGMKSKDEQSSRSLPLVALSYQLRGEPCPEENDCCEEMAPLYFRSSLTCAVVPNHLFKGLIKNMLEVVFKAVADDHRASVERRVRSTARHKGLNIDTLKANHFN